jgi:serine/threonine protein kinase
VVFKAVDLTNRDGPQEYAHSPDDDELDFDKQFLTFIKLLCNYVQPYPKTYYEALEKLIDKCDPENCKDVRYVAIKRLVRTSSPQKVYDELQYLKILDGKHHVIPVLDVRRTDEQVIIVFPYFPSHDIRDYMKHMTMEDIKIMMKQLFQALKHLHAHNIIHRDIKPTNFLYSFTKKRGVLLDFGLAEVNQS